MKHIFYAVLVLLTTLNYAIAKEFKLQQLSDGLGVPWGMTFITNNELLFTERAGRIGILNTQSTKVKFLNGLPKIFTHGQGGLLDVKVPANFKKGDWIYFTYSKDINGQGATTLAKARIEKNSIKDWTDIIVTQSTTDSGRHFGSRISFDNEGHLFFSVGDRGIRANAQNLNNHAGTILRLNIDGSTPIDNPFREQPSTKPEIWTYGHRNPQGLAWDNNNKRLWSIEHGPRGGDEINLIIKGENYGWPIISYGKEYWGPIAVGEGTHKKGMQQPIKYYIPSIAPGSLMLYTGDAFSHWKGSLFAGALKLKHLNRISLNKQGQAINEERLLSHMNERIRALAQDHKGLIYFSTDSGNIYRISPN